MADRAWLKTVRELVDYAYGSCRVAEEPLSPLSERIAERDIAASISQMLQVMAPLHLPVLDLTVSASRNHDSTYAALGLLRGWP